MVKVYKNPYKNKISLQSFNKIVKKFPKGYSCGRLYLVGCLWFYRNARGYLHFINAEKALDGKFEVHDYLLSDRGTLVHKGKIMEGTYLLESMYCILRNNLKLKDFKSKLEVFPYG